MVLITTALKPLIGAVRRIPSSYLALMADEANAQTGEISFVPKSWHEVTPGDRVVSRSGTVRTVLEISQARGRLAVAFRTRRTNGDVELETAHVDPLSTRGIREVLRRDPNAKNQRAAPLHLPMGIAKRFTPLTWSDLKPGDVVVSQSGSRRLILADLTDTGEPEFDCLYRSNAAVVERAHLTTTPASIEGVKEILRPASTINLESQDSDSQGASLTKAMINNIEALLGRGDLGDQFTQAMFAGADLALTSSQCVSISAVADSRTGALLEITPFSTDKDHPPVRLEIFMPADFDKPISISELYFHPYFPLAVAEEILLAATLSNTLKGVAPRQS